MKIDEISDDTTIKSVAQLIDLEERLNLANNEANSAKWSFRGQPRTYKTLVPSFQRSFSRRSFGTAQLIERRLIDEFRRHYARLTDRSSDMPQPKEIGRGFDLRCLSVMQHYEIPTRLLDWTSEFWTSVYFSCASDPTEAAELWRYDRRIFEQQRCLDGALASLVEDSQAPLPEPDFIDKRGEKLIIELDPKITPRMKKQSAYHTVSTDIFADHAPLLFSLAKKQKESLGEEASLLRVIIDASCKGKVLQFLAEHKGVTASTIFPDVVGLGRFLRWQFESLRIMLM